MPYDEQGNFIYPPPVRARKQAAVRPAKSSTSQTTPPDRTAAAKPAATKPALEININDLAPLEPQTSTGPDATPLTLKAEPAATFTIQDDANRWQMSELDLAQLWNAQLWPPGLRLVTTGGQAVEVVYRGRWSGGFGPDFKGALVRLGPHLLKGDIELHLRSGDWRLHGHQQDARYNEVVLQVTLEDNAAESALQTQAGRPLPVLALLPLFRQAGASLAAALEQVRAGGTRLGSLSESEGPCCERVAERIPALPSLLEQIDRLGNRRFEERATRYEAACAAGGDSSPTGPAEEFWAGLLEALGYSQNKQPFRRLASRLPLEWVVEQDQQARLRQESRADRVLNLEAALLGSAGLLPSQRLTPPASRHLAESSPFLEAAEPAGPLEDLEAGEYIEELERRWSLLRRELGSVISSEWQPLREQDWTFARLRPPNHPSRRLAGLARLVVNLDLEQANDLLERLAEAASAAPEAACQRLNRLFRAGLADEDTAGSAFWRRYFDFSRRAVLVNQRARAAPLDLIGSDRAADIVVNVALPCLAGYGRDRRRPALVQAALAAYAAHPRLGSNELVETIARQVFRHWLEAEDAAGPAKKLTVGGLVNGARRQQGLIYLHHHFCSEQNYAGCPLA